MDFLERNVFTILRAEYFNSGETAEPMTTFKHKRLELLMDNIRNFSKGEEHMNNFLLNHRFKKIQETERHAIDTSVETLQLLRIIVRNVNGMLNTGIPLQGIIEMGQYLRTRGDKVDFVKLETWISKLHLFRMAQLQGCILIDFFGFEADELPFVTRMDGNARKLALRSMHLSVKDTAEEWHYRQTSTGFVRNNGKMIRRHLRQVLCYFTYAPLETTSNLFMNFRKNLAEIEE